MTVIPITCDNCGAKYKLPETFTGAQAKCQKCGSVIDVARQRAGGTAPAANAPAAARPAAAAKPAAAARPAVDRSSKEPPKPAERPARAGKTSSGDAAGAGKARHARGERHEKKKANNMPVVLGGIGLLAIVVVVVLMMKGGDDKPKTDATAKADTPAAKPAEQPAAKPAAKPADAPPAAQKPVEPAPTDKPADTPADKPAETPPAAAPADATAKTDAPATTPGQPLKAWEKLKITSMDQVADPATYKEVVWPDTIDAAKKAAIQELVADVVNGGRAGISAKPKLVEHGYAALFGIVEQLRKLNYRSPDDSMVAFEFNKLLEQITADLQAGFVPVEAGEDIDPRKAEWNTRTVKTWLKLFEKYPDEAAFKKDKAERLKKAAGSDK